MPREATYFVINMEEVNIEKEHPYTLVFKGYVPTFGGNTLHTFTYNGDISSTCSMPENVMEEFKQQLREEYGFGIIFNKKVVRKKFETKKRYFMEM